MNWKDNKLTEKKRKLLKQGVKVEFKWHGSKVMYTGRIELDRFGRLYFVSEHNYKDDKLINEGMRFYNTLDSFSLFTHFEILS